MALFQRHPDGGLRRKTMLSDGTGDGRYVRSETTDDCCCEETVYWWYSLLSCSDELGSTSNPADLARCTDPDDCLWISEARRTELIVDAFNAGDIGSDPTFWPDYLVVWVTGDSACYRIYLNAPGGCPWNCVTTTSTAVSPGEEAEVTYLSTGCTADDCDTDGDGHPNPPPPHPLPDPAPTPTCPCDATYTDAAYCTCFPNLIRATVTGVTLCVCQVCGDLSYASARIKVGEVVDGTYDLIWNGNTSSPFWETSASIVLKTGGVAGVDDCLTDNSASWYVRLQKTSPTAWKFAIVTTVIDPTDPTGVDATTEQFFAFTGGASGSSRDCLNPPPMSNTATCSCVTTASGGHNVGHYYVGTSGSATFDACL